MIFTASFFWNPYPDKNIQEHPCQLLKTVPISRMMKLHLCIDALWAFWAKRKYNKSKDVNQNVTLHCHNSLIKAMYGLFKYIGNRTWFARAFSWWDHLRTVNFRTRAKENGMLFKNPNFVRTKWACLTLILCMHGKFWACKWQFYHFHVKHNLWIAGFPSLTIFFYLIIPLSVTPIRILPVKKKKLGNFRRIQLIAKISSKYSWIWLIRSPRD